MRALVVIVVMVTGVTVARADPPVTKAWMREVAKGKIQPSEVIEAERGIVELQYTSGEGEPPVIRRSKRLCGVTAAKRLIVLRTQWQQAMASDEIFACSNRGGARCTIGFVGEFMTTWDVELRVGAAGKLVIDTIIVRNSVYPPDDEPRVLARLRRKQAATGCAP